jgi:hypothetical protein
LFKGELQIAVRNMTIPPIPAKHCIVYSHGNELDTFSLSFTSSTSAGNAWIVKLDLS